MSQQEDDLRALAKIMDFLRATSIVRAVINIYWFYYEAIAGYGVKKMIEKGLKPNAPHSTARYNSTSNWWNNAQRQERKHLRTTIL